MRSISVLIPAYNAERTLARALSSVVGTVQNIIVVNDGSTDNTAQIVSQRFPHVKLVNLPHNIGVGAVRNICLEYCKTPYAAWLDSDDVFLPRRIETLLPDLESGADYVYDTMEVVDEHNHIIAPTEYPKFLNEPGGVTHQFGRNYIKGIGVPLVNTKSARQVSYGELSNAEDYDHFLRALLAGKHIVLSTSRTYRQYIQSDSQSADKLRQYRAMKIVIRNLDKRAVQLYIQKSALAEKGKWRVELLFLSNAQAWEALYKRAFEIPISYLIDELWLSYFMQAVALAKLGDINTAITANRQALSLIRKPESLNNQGVLEMMNGHRVNMYFTEALRKFPNYLDAKNNLQGRANLLTLVPLR